ncbi:unnamed protein product, partial [Discosporangium mesarthrocarpum]
MCSAYRMTGRRKRPVGALTLAALVSGGNSVRRASAFNTFLVLKPVNQRACRQALLASAHKAVANIPTVRSPPVVRLPVGMSDVGVEQNGDVEGDGINTNSVGSNARDDVGGSLGSDGATSTGANKDGDMEGRLLSRRQEEHLQKMSLRDWDEDVLDGGFQKAARGLLERGQVGGPATMVVRKLTREEHEEKRLYQKRCEDKVYKLSGEGKWRKALEVLQEHKQEGKSLTPRVYNTVLRAVGTAGLVRPSVILINEMRKEGFDVSMYNYGCALHACAKSGAASAALMLLEEMRLDGLQPNEVAYTSAIKACGPGNHWRETLGLLERMEAEGTPPNGHHYNAALSVMGKAGEYRRAMQILVERDQRGLDRCPFTYVAAIDAAGRAGEVDVALGLLKEMREDGLKPKLLPINAAIFACAHARKPNKATADAAAALIEEAVTEGMRLDHKTYSGAMMAMTLGGQVPRAIAMLDHARMHGFMGGQVSMFMYSSALTACRFARADDRLPEGGDWWEWSKNKSRSALGEAGGGQQPQHHSGGTSSGESPLGRMEGWTTRSVVVEALASAERDPPRPALTHHEVAWELGRGLGEEWDREVGQELGEVLLRRMETEGVVADAVLCTSLMQLWGDAPGFKGWQRATELLRMMKSGSTPGGMKLPPPCDLTYAQAISVCGRCNQPDEALRLLWEMQEEGLRASLQVYLAAMGALKAAGPSRARDVLRLFEDMRAIEVRRDTAAYQAAAEACAALGAWEQGMEILSQMHRQRVKPTTKVYNALILACARAGRWYRCTRLLGAMGRYGDTDRADLLSYRYTIAAVGVAGEFRVAMGILRDMVAAGLRPEAHDYEILLNTAIAGGGDSAAGAGEVVTHMLLEAQRVGRSSRHGGTKRRRGRSSRGGAGAGAEATVAGTRGGNEAGTGAEAEAVDGARASDELSTVVPEQAKILIPGLRPGVLEAGVFRRAIEACLRAQRPKAAYTVVQGVRVVEQVRKALAGSGPKVDVEEGTNYVGA